MLQLHSVRKSYTTGSFTQTALDDVSIAFRDNEFVAVLGPSGSGKTTLLNIVGGLDHADSGSLEIDGIDTSEFQDREWDTYRNNRIGFVFQSYNLIPHQTVLANVELALTLSGVSREERHQRATDALERVGLGEHVHKRPNQLSGGQMQRVAIARALINDPEILLADEPTGALDSTTSVQIMAMLTEIAKDRLVIMVTHNPELADQYATRVVSLKDGRVDADSDPFDPAPENLTAKAARRTSMSFFTAIALSFNNLMTKKGRTLMTAFAGSIGIIGIAAILALANGVNDYIASIEEDTLSMYPLQIQSQGLDMTALLMTGMDMSQELDSTASTDVDAPSGEVREVDMLSRFFSSVGSNDLASLKTFLDGNGGDIESYANSIEYSYNVTPQLFTELDDGSVRQVNPDSTFAALGFGGGSSASSLMSAQMAPQLFQEMVSDRSLIEEQYDVVAGDWPQGPDEVLLVLTASGSISDFAFFAMGLRDPAELDEMVRSFANDEPIVTPEGGARTFSYEEIMDVSFTRVNPADYFVFDENYGVWTDRSSDQAFVQDLVADGDEIRISGIAQPRPGSNATALQPGFYYSPEMITQLVNEARGTEIVQSQLARPAYNVFSGRTFADEAENPQREEFDMASLVTIDEEAIANAFTFDESKLSLDLSSLNISMPDLQIDPSTLPEMDLGDLMGGIDMDLDIDLESVLTGLDLSGVDLGVDQEQITAAAERLATGYAAFCAAGNDCTDPAASFQAFLATDEGLAIVAEFETIAGDAQAGLEGIQEELTSQLVEGITAAVEQQVAANAGAMQAQIQSAMSQYMNQAMAAVGQQVQAQLGAALERQIGSAMQQAMGSLAANMSDAMGIDQAAFMDAFQFEMDETELAQLLATMMTTQQATFDTNLVRLGYADFANPSQISIFPKDFESKGRIIEILDEYNAQAKADGDEDRVITYTDFVGALMTSVTDVVNVVSYVLVAFVSISLVVSSIMIGVITYISVLERKKEIGILRSIGASKRDIRRVFNAETLIVGFVAGVIGIGATLLLTIPANAIVSANFDIEQVAILPWQAGVILVAISMGLTFLAGLIPSSAASRKDPVEALRSE